MRRRNAGDRPFRSRKRCLSRRIRIRRCRRTDAAVAVGGHRVLLLELGDTKIEHLHGIAAALIWFEPDIVGFEIAVDDALAVGFVDGRADLFEDIERPGDRQVLFLVKYLAERAAVEVFHHEIRDLAVL